MQATSFVLVVENTVNRTLYYTVNKYFVLIGQLMSTSTPTVPKSCMTRGPV